CAAQPRRSGNPRRLFAVPGAVADRVSDHAAGCRRHRDVRIPVVLVGISVRAGLLYAERFENHATAAQRLFRRGFRRMGQCYGRLVIDHLATPASVSAIADADALWPRRRFSQAIITYFDSALLDRLRADPADNRCGPERPHCFAKRPIYANANRAIS